MFETPLGNKTQFTDSMPLHVAAPEGLAPPQLVGVDETTLRVIWTAPEKPNGEITAYNIYLDDVKIETGLKYAGTYTLQDLVPFQIYMVQVT